MLSACNSPVYNQTENNVADVKLKAKAAREKSDNSGKISPSLLMKKGSYVDKTPISLYRNPPWLKDRIVIKGEALPFSYYSRTLAKGAGSDVLTKYQQGLDQNAKVSLNYSGTVQGALKLLASKSGYVYSIQGGTIYWQAFVTKTFDIAFMPGSTDYLMGKKSGGGGTAGGAGSDNQDATTTDGAADQYSNIGGKLSVWRDLQTTIGQLISPEGSLTVSEATSSVTVRDKPTNLKLIGQYIANMNAKLSKQVLVKVQILSVDLTNTYNMGIDWQVIAKAFHNSPFIMNGSYGTPVSLTSAFVEQTASTLAGPFGALAGKAAAPQFGTVGNGGVPSYTILFNALNQQGKTSVVTEPRVVALNNQVSVIKITEQEGYVASIQNTAGTGDGAAQVNGNTVTSQVNPGTIVTGLTLYILPKIMKDKIYLQVNADLSNKLDLLSFGTGASIIQLPKVASKSFNQRSVIRSGETMILAGLRALANQANATQMLKSQALGGKGSLQASTETVVLITPIILQESA
tara:strand:+ start:4310 stop:5860 length:1551 start_codon:yes stop_codon:yes gene_type:complete